MKILGRLVAVAVVAVGVWMMSGGWVSVAQEPTSQSRDMGHPGSKRAMTFADLMAMKRVSDPEVSPGGKWVMFSVTEVSLDKNTKVNHLWVVPLDGSKPERQLTSNAGESFGRFSPDGKFVSYTGAPSKGDAVSRITLATWDDATGAIGTGRTLKAVSGNADGAIWSPDSKHLLFTTDVYPDCSDKATWAEEDACDKAKDDAADKSPVKGQVWDHLLYRHWDQYTGQKRSHIIEADSALVGPNPNANSNSVRDLTPASAVGNAQTPTFFLGGVQNYAWAPDSKEIAYVVNLDPMPAASTNNDIFTLRLDTAGAKAVKVSTSPGSDDGPAYSQDGKWLAFRSQARGGFESDRFDLVVMDRSNGHIDSILPRLTNGRGEPINDNWVDEFSWAPDSQKIAIASPDHGREIVQVNPLPLQSGPTAAIGWTASDAELGSLSYTGDGRIVAVQMVVNRPAEIVLLTHTTTGQQGSASFFSSASVWPVSHQNDALLAQLDLPNLEPFQFEGAESTQVEGFILRPPNFDPAKKYPVKFLMHGGPQTAWGDGWSYRWNWELMAASGYVVVGVNRRGSTGYGQKFVDQVSGDWGGRAYEDLMKGLDYAEAHYSFIDKTRECALGASYGGFMADWALTHTNRFQCIVTHDGMVDPVSAYGSTEEMWFNEWEFRTPDDFPAGWDGSPALSAKTAGGPGLSGAGKGAGHPAAPWRYAGLPADQDPFRRWSPMRFIQNAKTPTLVIHSQKDYRLDVSQGMELFTALQRLGVPSKMLYFPDEGHWVLKPQNSQLWYDTVGDWCDRWTHTGKYAGAGAK